MQLEADVTGSDRIWLLIAKLQISEKIEGKRKETKVNSVYKFSDFCNLDLKHREG